MITPTTAGVSIKSETLDSPPGRSWFYTAMALVAFAIAIAGFGPAIVNPAHRKAPLTFWVAVHGLIFTAWLVLFLVQTLLVGKGRVNTHRKLGYAGAGLALLLVLVGYNTTIAMARRGFDLSGDLKAAKDLLGLLVFHLGDLLAFTILVAAAVRYRRRPEIHKRLMLLATLGTLMAAPLSPLISHLPRVREMNPAVILVPLVMLYFASAIHDRLSSGRIHPVSLWVAIALFLWGNLRAAVINPNPTWRRFATWLVG